MINFATGNSDLRFFLRRESDAQGGNGQRLCGTENARMIPADVEPGLAEFMVNAQVPWGLDAMIPIPAQRMMANRAGAKTVDQAGSHAVYVSQPKAVAAIIEDAARCVNN